MEVKEIYLCVKSACLLYFDYGVGVFNSNVLCTL